MPTQGQELDHLLSLIEERIDLDHCEEVDARFRRALAWQDTDRPPLIVQAAFGGKVSLPAPWDAFHHFKYRRIFDDPVAMMQNMLLERVAPGVLLRDDNPLAIRNDHGTIQVASLLGGQWRRTEDNYPWIEKFTAREDLERAATAQRVDPNGGVLPRSLRTLRLYLDRLADLPACRESIQVSMPDLQGPIDTAELLWGSEIFRAFYDDRALLDRLLTRVVDAMLEAAEIFRGYARDRLDPVANTQHGYVIPGRLMIRNDTAIMLSPDMYAEIVRPHDARALKAVGGGAIHFCGDGSRLVGRMLEIPDLRGVDFGQPELVDVARIYAQCREMKVALTNVRPSRDDLMTGKARRDFPTGVVLVYLAESIADAEDVVGAYKGA